MPRSGFMGKGKAWDNIRKSVRLSMAMGRRMSIDERLGKAFQMEREAEAGGAKMLAIKTVLRKPPSLRSEEDIESLSDLCRHNAFLQNLSETTQKELLKAAGWDAYTKDDVVYEEGQKGDKFYVIMRGTVSIHVSHVGKEASVGKAEDSGDPSVPPGMAGMDPATQLALKKHSLQYGGIVKILKQGDSFGELALLNSAPRSATVISIADKLDLLSVSKEDYLTVLHSVQQAEFRSKIAFLRLMEPLYGWTDLRLQKMALYLNARTLHSKTVLVQEGSPTSDFFLVRSGTLKMMKRVPQLQRLLTGSRRGDNPVSDSELRMLCYSAFYVGEEAMKILMDMEQRIMDSEEAAARMLVGSPGPPTATAPGGSRSARTTGGAPPSPRSPRSPSFSSKGPRRTTLAGSVMVMSTFGASLPITQHLERTASLADNQSFGHLAPSAGYVPRELELGQLARGDFCGETLLGLCGAQPWSVVAEHDSEVFFVKGDDFVRYFVEKLLAHFERQSFKRIVKAAKRIMASIETLDKLNQAIVSQQAREPEQAGSKMVMAKLRHNRKPEQRRSAALTPEPPSTPPPPPQHPTEARAPASEASSMSLSFIHNTPRPPPLIVPAPSELPTGAPSSSAPSRISSGRISSGRISSGRLARSRSIREPEASDGMMGRGLVPAPPAGPRAGPGSAMRRVPSLDLSTLPSHSDQDLERALQASVLPFSAEDPPPAAHIPPRRRRPVDHDAPAAPLVSPRELSEGLDSTGCVRSIWAPSGSAGSASGHSSRRGSARRRGPAFKHQLKVANHLLRGGTFEPVRPTSPEFWRTRSVLPPLGPVSVRENHYNLNYMPLLIPGKPKKGSVTARF